MLGNIFLVSANLTFIPMTGAVIFVITAVCVSYRACITAGIACCIATVAVAMLVIIFLIVADRTLMVMILRIAQPISVILMSGSTNVFSYISLASATPTCFITRHRTGRLFFYRPRAIMPESFYSACENTTT